MPLRHPRVGVGDWRGNPHRPSPAFKGLHQASCATEVGCRAEVGAAPSQQNEFPSPRRRRIIPPQNYSAVPPRLCSKRGSLSTDGIAMADFARLALERFRDKWRKTTAKQTTEQTTPTPPTVAWLLAHRDERMGERAQTPGRTPTASLYRMYEYLVVGYTIGLRTEIEFFFNRPTWAVAEIPDPEDPDPERYAILAVLPFYLCMAFNRLIERGLPRGSPAIIMGLEMEEELKRRPVVLEEEPSWVARVPALPQVLVIPDESGKEPPEEERSLRFLDMNIIAEEPHVLFV